MKAALERAARIILLLAVALPARGESLWSPDFKGYLSGSRGLAAGDALVVQIDASSSLSFSSSSNDSKNLTLEFSGGVGFQPARAGKMPAPPTVPGGKRSP